jgi:hypothetical protein
LPCAIALLAVHDIRRQQLPRGSFLAGTAYGGEVLLPGVTGGLSGVTTVESVQDYAGIGPVGGEFAGDFLRNTAAGNPASPTILTLNDGRSEPSHESIVASRKPRPMDAWGGRGET